MHISIHKKLFKTVVKCRHLPVLNALEDIPLTGHKKLPAAAEDTNNNNNNTNTNSSSSNVINNVILYVFLQIICTALLT